MRERYARRARFWAVKFKSGTIRTATTKWEDPRQALKEVYGSGWSFVANVMVKDLGSKDSIFHSRRRFVKALEDPDGWKPIEDARKEAGVS